MKKMFPQTFWCIVPCTNQPICGKKEMNSIGMLEKLFWEWDVRPCLDLPYKFSPISQTFFCFKRVNPTAAQPSSKTRNRALGLSQIVQGTGNAENQVPRFQTRPKGPFGQFAGTFYHHGTPFEAHLFPIDGYEVAFRNQGSEETICLCKMPKPQAHRNEPWWCSFHTTKLATIAS